MAKRHHYTATTQKHENLKIDIASAMENMSEEIRSFTNAVTKYFWAAYSMMNGHYVAIASVIIIVVLSFMVPDISQKIPNSGDITSMKKFLDLMSERVSQAEVACLTAADEICTLHSSMKDDTTETSRQLRDISVDPGHFMRTTQSEPIQVEKKIGLFRKIFFPKRNTLHKEITIMSYIYTDSFDKHNE